MKMNNKVYLSIDFEDFHYIFKRKLGLVKNITNKKAIWHSYEIINNFLETKLDSAKITFFCTGTLATIHPDLIRKISSDGHEIACHYYHHDSVRNENLDEFESNILLSINELEKCSSNKVTGFRAPNFSIKATDVSHFKIISKYFKYDSSLNTNKKSEIEKLKQSINSNEFKLIPVVAEKPYLGFPYMIAGGSYLKLFPVHFALKVILKNLNKNQIAQVYLHPYEFVSDRSFYISWKDMKGLSFYKKFYWLLRQSQWLIIGNKTVTGKLEKIFSKYENGGKLKDI
tara:strand:+ start:191 stop:1045 length:855 start_codon:yes stop_codon:yes gene_type:complete